MPTDYQEGPYKNWTAIHFGAVVYKAFLLPAPNGALLSIFGFNADDSPALGVTGAQLQAVITGDTSGAQIDMRSITVTANGLETVSGPDVTACVIVYAGGYAYPGGGSLGAAPVVAASIKERVDGVIGAVASIHTLPSFSYDASEPPTGGSCVVNADAPAMPAAFTSGETCTLTYPDL